MTPDRCGLESICSPYLVLIRFYYSFLPPCTELICDAYFLGERHMWAQGRELGGGVLAHWLTSGAKNCFSGISCR